MDVSPWGACWLQDEAGWSMPMCGLGVPMDVWPWGACWLQDEACQFKGLERLEIFWASWTPRRSHGCVALGCLLAAGWSMPRDCLSDPEEAIDVWPRAGCWLQDEACQVSVGRVSQSIGGGLPRQQRFKGFKLFRGLERLEGLRAGKRQAWTPIRSHGCVALEGIRAGKRQAWTPIRSHGCVALGCLLAAGWSMPMCGLGVPVGCRMKHANVWPWGAC